LEPAGVHLRHGGGQHFGRGVEAEAADVGMLFGQANEVARGAAADFEDAVAGLEFHVAQEAVAASR